MTSLMFAWLCVLTTDVSQTTAPAMEKTVQFGRVTVVLRQSVDALGTASCDVETSSRGQPLRKRSSKFLAAPGFSGCFSFPGEQTAGGYLMVRENRERGHTMLIADNGAVLDIDEMLVRGGRWDLVQAD